jgi:hypothetical protein
MARLVFRMLVTAGVGTLLGLASWLQHQTRFWLVDPEPAGWPLGTYLLGGAGIGALLALVLDLLGLDLPLFPERQSRSEVRQERAFSAYLAALQAAKRSGESLPAPPSGPEPAPVRDAIRNGSSGSHEGWIDRESADRIQGRLARSQVRLQLLLAASLLTLLGMGGMLFHLVLSGGDTSGGLLFFGLAIVCCAAVVVLELNRLARLGRLTGIGIAIVAHYFH